MVGKLDNSIEKNETRPSSHIKHEMISKWIKNLNVIPETTELLEENIDAKLLDIGLGNDFFFFFWIWQQQQRQEKQK